MTRSYLNGSFLKLWISSTYLRNFLVSHYAHKSFFTYCLAFVLSIFVFIADLLAADNVKFLITDPIDHGGGSVVRLGEGKYLLHDIGNSPGNSLRVTQFVDEIRRDVGRHHYTPHLTFISSHPQEDAFNLIKPTIESLRGNIGPLYVDFILGGNRRNYQRTEAARELIRYVENDLGILPIYSNGTRRVEFGTRQVTNGVSILNPCSGGTYRGPGRHYTYSEKVNYEDLNRISLITRIERGNISALLPGGAKNFELVSAAANNYLFDLKSNIAVTSHHGGDGAIDEDPRYYGLVQPQYVISSVSPKGMYNHPYEESVINAYGSPRLANFPLGNGYNGHNIRYFVRRGVNQWTTPALTTCGIFSTLTQGDVNFSWGNLDHHPRIILGRF